MSTLDLVGRGFTPLTGSEGGAWAAAAGAASAGTGVPLEVRAVAGEVQAVLRIGRTGAVLVRPDGHVARRRGGPAADAVEALTLALVRAAGLGAAAGAEAGESRVVVSVG